MNTCVLGHTYNKYPIGNVIQVILGSHFLGAVWGMDRRDHKMVHGVFM